VLSATLFVATAVPFTSTLYSLAPYGAECLTIRLYVPAAATFTFIARLSVSSSKLVT